MPAGNTDTTSGSGVPNSGVKQTDMPGNTPNTGAIRSEHETDKTGVTSANQPASYGHADRPSNSNDTSGPGPAPSVGADPASGQQNTQKHQGADRPHEEPNKDEHQRIKDAKAEAEKAQEVDVSGPGPQPLSKTHGNAGKAQKSSSSGDDDDGPQSTSHGEGTGEKYVKSSGMKADGGDFDAAAPGAGKEADRKCTFNTKFIIQDTDSCSPGLLEQKGIHHEVGAVGGGSDKKTDPLEDKLNKPSLGEKIKSKMHKH